jgi:3',5'-cyclic-AMP phosphodiesterase
VPFLFDKQTTRRRFLGTAIASASALAFGAQSWAYGEDAPSTRWAFFSDIHTPRDPSNEYRGFRPYDNLKKTVGEIVAAKPEGAIITGDLARLEGFAGDYAALKTLADPLLQSMPVCMTMGNHDDRANFLNAFKEHPGVQTVPEKHVMVVEKGPVRFVLLDSLMFTNKVPGLIGKAQRNWLREFLRNSEAKPTLLFFHHTLSEDDGSLLDTERLFGIITPATSVKAVVFGHSHVYDIQQRMGIHLINLPSTAYNFRDSDALGWVEAEMTAEGGAFTLRAIAGNQEKNGETTRLKWRA